MENKIGKEFESLARRIIYSYVGTLPPFIPALSEEAAEESQEQLYSFIRQMSEKLYTNPEIIGLSVEKDDYYDDWVLQNQKPDLIKSMRAIRKKIEDFYTFLIKIGQYGQISGDRLFIKKEDVKFTSKALTKLNNFLLESELQKEETVIWSNEYPHIFSAWKQLSNLALCGVHPILTFSHCMFSVEYNYSRDIFYELIGDKAIISLLEEYFKNNGYEYIDIREKELSSDWVKSYGKKDDTLKDSWAEREHGGLSISYDYTKKNQIIYGLRVPRYKELLSNFDKMDDDLKSFVIRCTKKCDGCGYCTQTDKTGLRPRQVASVDHNGKYNLCQLFPGFSYRWTGLNNELASNIIKFLSFADSLFQK